MNITIFKMLVRFLSLIVVSASSLLNSVSISTNLIGIYNGDENMSSSVIDTVVKYETITVESSKYPIGTEKVRKGQDGIYYLDANGKPFKTIQEKIDEIITIGTGKEGKYTGILTGYGADCDGCSGVVACPNERGHYHNIYKEGIYYTDKEYGKVRIVAADQREFPCGTIVEVDNPQMEKFYAIVIDTGIDMRKHYKNGIIHMDLAHMSERDTLRFPTSYNTNYVVQRWGW